MCHPSSIAGGPFIPFAWSGGGGRSDTEVGAAKGMWWGQQFPRAKVWGCWSVQAELSDRQKAGVTSVLGAALELL